MKLFIFLCLTLASYISEVTSFEDIPDTKCTAKELEEFSQEYETCHTRALQAVKADRLQILKKSR